MKEVPLFVRWGRVREGPIFMGWGSIYQSNGRYIIYGMGGIQGEGSPIIYRMGGQGKLQYL